MKLLIPLTLTLKIIFASNDFIDIIDKMITSVKRPHITGINIIANVSSDIDFQNDLLREIGSRVTIRDVTNFLTNGTIDRKFLFNILIFDEMEKFLNVIKKFSHHRFEFGGFYIIIYENGTHEEIHKIYQSLWNLYIYNVNSIRREKDEILIETFYPFNVKSCNKTNPELMLKYERGTHSHSTINFFPQKMSNFNNCSIKVLTFESIGPAVLKEDFANGSYRLHGRDIYMLEAIAGKLNFHANIFYNTTYGAWGTMVMNGDSTGAFNAAKVRNTDVTLGNVNMKIERAIHLGYTLPYASDIFIFIIPPGRPLSSFEKLLSPFKIYAWTALTFVFLLCFVAIAFLETKGMKKLRNLIIGTEVSSPYINVFLAVFGGSQKHLPVDNFPRFLLMTFLIFCLIIRTLYQGSLFKYLQSNDNAKEPESIEEMADQNYTFYLIFSYYDFTKDNAAMQGKRHLADPELIKVLMDKVTDSHFKGTIMSKLSQVVYKNHERAMTQQELYRVCKEQYMMIPITMYFPKNSYLVDPFNHVILYLHASGLMNFWTSLNEDIKYLNFDASSKEPKMLTVEHLSGAFETWFAMCCVSVAVFLIEKFKCSRKLN